MSILDLSNEQLNRIEHDFKKVPAQNRLEQLFGVLESCNEDELICMKYLYAYMPISDLASYGGSFFLKTVRDTLHILKNVSWGNQINGELFFNYVLPLRLNNEDLVDHRELFFNELFPRIEKLTLKEAVLEVNYWCYEKATYKSTDIRTSSPLNVVRNAFGRCGEESVLCVAALRSVGIPARQCYTPRWAHCDDNHAWVEVWVDGVWHFIGACEPEAVLDKGWFAEPAKRGMLIHARVFSRMVSEPEITNQSDVMSQVNILNHYAKTKTLLINVADENGIPVKDAEVRFELINFAQLYPLATIKTDALGNAHLLTGFGDLYVHVSKNGKFLHKKANHDCVNLNFCTADFIADENESFILDMVPPMTGDIAEPNISKAMAEQHSLKMASADKLRLSFMDSFIAGEKATAFAARFDSYQDEIAELITLSNGNHEEISDFLQTKSSIPLELRVVLLKSLRPKDLSDSSCFLLNQHLEASYQYIDNTSKEIFISYILCPRVYFEMLSDYKNFIFEFFNSKQKALFINAPKEIFDYIEKNIVDCDARDYSTIFASPQGLLELKSGSDMSKKILFVAICRTLGIPARMSEIDLKAEFYQNDCWHTVAQSCDKPVNRSCKLTLNAKNQNDTFVYEKNFTIARLENGVYNTLGLSEFPLFEGRVSYMLQSGQYRLTTSNRLNDGSILAAISHFCLSSEQETVLTLHLREDDLSDKKAVLLPKINVRTTDNQTVCACSLIASSKAHSIAYIQVGSEPTEHLLNEILEQKEAFLQNNKSMLLILQNENSLKNPLLQLALSQTGISYAYVDENDVFDDILKALDTENRKLPLVLGLQDGNNCIFHTSGYNVGTGDLLLRHFTK